MDLTRFDNVVVGSGYLARALESALANETALEPIYGHKLAVHTQREKLERVYVSGDGVDRCFYLKDYTEIDFLCDAETLRMDLLAIDILDWVKTPVDKQREWFINAA